MPSVRILPLSAVPEWHAEVADILCATWPDYYGPGGDGDAAAHVTARAEDQDLPVGFAAITQSALGTATLGAQSFGSRPADRGPWLIGLAVMPAARHRGIGTALVAAVEDYARSTGARDIFATTRTATGLLKRRGWAVIRDVADDEAQLWQVCAKRL